MQTTGRILIVSFAALVLSATAWAQSPGDLHTSLNPGTGADSRVLAVSRHPDGRLVVGGQFTVFNGLSRRRLTQLNYDGSTDTSFDPGSAADGTINAVAVAPDGKVIAGGDFLSFNGITRERLVRLNADGSVDTSFSATISGTVQSVAVQPDGKVLLAGGFSAVNGVTRTRVARLNTDGSLDTTFDPGTGPNAYVLSLFLQSDGRVLLGGYFWQVNGVTRNRVARLNADGSVDTGFVPGTLDNGYASSVTVAPDGKVIVCGGLYAGSSTRILRLHASGALDTTFSSGSNLINSDVITAVAQSDGKVIIGGYFTVINGVSRPYVARLDVNGALDTAFDPGVGASDYLWAILIEPDGALVAGGAFTTYQGISRNRLTRIHNTAVNQTPLMDAIADVTVLEDSGLFNVSVSGIAPGPLSEIAQTVTNLTATSSAPGVLPHPVVSYTPGSGTATLALTPAADANGTVTITVIATDNAALPASKTNTFTVTITPVNDAPSFALAAGSWQTQAAMPAGRLSALAGAIGGKVYVAGGLDAGSGGSAQASLLIYDTVAGTWGAGADMPTPRYEAAGGVINGKLYVVGGWSPSLGSQVYEYDPGTDMWASRTDLGHLSAGGSAGVIGGKLYLTSPVFGGSGLSTAFDVYDPVADTWTALAAATKRYHSAGAVAGGKFYLFGGHDEANTAQATADVFDPDTGLWSSIAPMPGARAWATAVELDGKILVLGGVDGVGAEVASVAVYDPVMNTWQTLVASPTARFSGASTVVGGVVYYAGGAVGASVTTVHQSLSAGMTVLEDAGAQSVAAFATSISAGPADESAQTVSFTVSNDNNALFSSQPAIGVDGTLTFTSAPNVSGAATVTVYAQDDGGTANGGVDLAGPQTFTITVTPVNDAPTIAFATNNVVVLEDSGAFSGSLATFGTGGGDSGQSITNVVTSNSASNLFLVQPVVALDGTLTFTSAADSNGVATVTVIAEDDGGTDNGGVNRTTNTFTITITPVNDAPSFALPAGPAAAAAQGPWTVTTVATGFNHAVGVVKDSVGNVFACNAFDNKIMKITPGGMVSDFATGILNPGWMAIDGADNLYVTSTDANKVVKITPAGVVSDFAGSGTAAHLDGNGTSAQLNYPTGIARDSAGNLYVAEGNGNTIRKITPAGDVTTIAGTDGTSGSTDGTGAAARFNSPMGMGIDSADNLYVADGNNHTIRKVTPAGVVTTVAGLAGTPGAADGTASAARFYAPQDVKVDAAGNLLVADFVNHAIRQVTPDGVVTTIIGALGSSGFVDGADSSVRLNQPRGLWVDTSGTVYIGEWGNNAVRKAVPALAAVGGSSGPYTVTVNEDSGAYAGGANFATSISAGPANESSQVVSFVVTNDNNALFSSQPAIATDGTLTFTSAPNANGSATVTVYAQDNGGTANGGVDLAGPQTFTITVTPVNDAPSATFASNPLAVMKNSSPTNIAGFATFSTGPADESSQSITNVTVSNDNNALFDAGGQPVIDLSGALSFQPAAGAVGTAIVTVITEDNGGTANGGQNTGTSTFVINVVGANIYVEATAPVAAGNTLTVPVSILADGDENGVGFTLTFDPALLTFSSISAESGLTLVANSAQVGSGLLGVVLSKPTDNTFASGYSPMAYVTFTVASSAPATNTTVGFSSAVAYKQVTDKNANNIPYVAYTPNVVTISALAAGVEGDVTPRPTGNGTVTVSDAVQIGRFAAGLDTITSFGAGSEFQRADCAPLGSQGDGRVTVADWVQTLRFAAGLDTPGAAGGPTMQAASLAASRLRVPAGNRVVRVASGSLVAGRANTVSVQVDAQGNEAGLSLSLAFDPTALSFVNATVGGGANGGSLMVNSSKAGSGRVGLVLVMPAGSSLAAGTRDVVTLTFNVSGSGSTAINVNGDAPVAREVADVNANPVEASFVGGTFNIILPAGLKAAGMERAADGSLRLVVRNADGSAVTTAQAAKYQVQVTSNLGGTWTVLPNALVVENGALKIVDPAASSAGMRLYKLVETP